MDRTRFEKHEVLTAPIAIELAAVAKSLVDLIKKLPAEARPAGLAAALALVEGLRLAADAFVDALPEDPNEVGSKAIRAAADRLREAVERLPATSPISDLDTPAAAVDRIERMVATFGRLPATVPHAFTTKFIA